MTDSVCVAVVRPEYVWPIKPAGHEIAHATNTKMPNRMDPPSYIIHCVLQVHRIVTGGTLRTFSALGSLTVTGKNCPNFPACASHRLLQNEKSPAAFQEPPRWSELLIAPGV